MQDKTLLQKINGIDFGKAINTVNGITLINIPEIWDI